MRKIKLTLFLSVVTFVLCIFQIINSTFIELVIQTLLFPLVNYLYFKNSWKYLYDYAKKGIILFFVLSIFLITIYSYYQNPLVLVLHRFINIGIISTILVFPSIFDTFAIYLGKYKLLNYFFEGFILFRNKLVMIASDFSIGLMTAPVSYKRNLKSRIGSMFLMSLTLVARTPELIINTLIASKMSNFEIAHLKRITFFDIELLKGLLILIIMLTLMILL